MSEHNQETIPDPAKAAAAAARAELRARAERLRASGWVEPPDWPFGLIYKTAATSTERAVHRALQRARLRRRHEVTKARALEILSRRRDKPHRMVYKTHVNARPEPCVTKAAPIAAESITMTETTKPESPFEVLAGELGTFAGRVEKETILKFKNLKAELELDLERRLNEQALQIAELRGQLAALSGNGAMPPRTARAAQADKPTDFDFNQARAAVRN